VSSIFVSLTSSEDRLARAIARERKNSNRAAGVTDARRWKEDPDPTGVLAEFAVAKAFNVWPDLTIAVQGHTADLVIGGFRVDVKGTPRKDGQLLVVASKQVKDCDVFVLVTIGDRRRHAIRGWLPSDQVITDANLADLGYGPTYAVPQRRLLDILKAPFIEYLQGDRVEVF
jgi:hypothetical protein